MNTELRAIFERLSKGEHLSRSQARFVFDRIMSGNLPETTIAAVAGALLTLGENVDLLVGAAQAMRDRAIKVRCTTDCIDTCGTGGDGISTFNVSTAAAIVAASAGATVAKHGNRSTTRVSGSTEVLTHLGIDVEADHQTVEQCLEQVRIGYLNARLCHPAMKYTVPVRQAIPVRTVFNLLGPLTNPAGAKRQLLGVPRPELTETLAFALRELGAVHAWVVHGGDGLCDLTITSETHVTELREGRIEHFDLAPDLVGLQRASLSDLRIDSPQASANVIRQVFDGVKGAARDHTLLNAGAALVVAGLADDLEMGVRMAADAIDRGAAKMTLRGWRNIAGIED